jgi:predicted RNase H-like HicB family nuclease
MLGDVVLNYRVAYRLQMGAFFAEVLDFPEATAIGATVTDARHNLVSALRYAAENRLRRGEFLPMPDPTRTAPDAYTLEMVTLIPSEGNRVAVQVGG